MNRVCLAAIVMAAGGVVGCGSQSPSAATQVQVWAADVDKKGEDLGYRVKWPAEPTFADTQPDVMTGKTQNQTAVATVRGKGTSLTYTVSVVRYPSGEDADKTPPQDIIREFVTPPGRIEQQARVTETEFGSKKYPAAQVAGERTDTHFRQLVVLVGRTLYSVSIAGTPAEKVNGAEGDEFIKSFELLK